MDILRFTQSEKQEIKQRLKQIAFKDGFHEHDAQNLLEAFLREVNASSLNPETKKKRVRRMLHEKSHPVRAAFDKQFNERCMRLKKDVPGLVQIETHPDFEENFIVLHFRVERQDGWELFLEKLLEHVQDVDALLCFLRCEQFEVT